MPTPTPYRYTGPVSGVTLKITPAAKEGEPAPEATDRPIVWTPGKAYDDLPVNHPQIAAMIARGLLVSVPAEAEGKQPKQTTPTPKSEAK